MKRILILSLIVIFSYQLHAQSHLFVKAGISHSNLTPPSFDNIQTRFKTGPQFGLLYSYQFKNRFNIRTEFLFTDKGYTNSDTQNSPIQYRFFYLNMPILTGYQYKKFNFEIGPELGYLLTAFYQQGYHNNEIRGLFEKFEIGALAGVSYTIIDQLLINLRYSRGVIPVADFYITDTGINGRQVKVYNQSLQLSIAWRLF